MPNPVTTSGRLENPSPMRSSEILRGILSNNPGIKKFTVRRILASIGSDRFDASLLMFSIPGIVPVPGPQGFAAMPAGSIAYQLALGAPRIQLPHFILQKKISRQALAVAIHAVLPLLEVAEKYLQPRWTWMDHAAMRRALGLFTLLLAIALGCPLLGFTPLHATSIFVIALGMAERDGLAVLLGVAGGLVGLALDLSAGVSARVLRSKALRWLRKLTRKLGTTTLATLLDRKGYPALAALLRFQWSDLLLVWNPEPPAPGSARRAPRPNPLRLGSGGQSIERSRVLRVDPCGARVRQQPRVQTAET